MRNLLSAVLFASAFVVSGCATVSDLPVPKIQYEMLMSSYRSAECCVTFKDMAVGTITDKVEFKLGEDRRLLISPSGKAFYKAFLVPSGAGPHYFKLDSYTMDVEGRLAVVFPIVYVLNDDFSISRMSNLSSLRYTQKAISGTDEETYLYIKVDAASKPREKYVVVTTPESIIGKVQNQSTVPTSSSMVVVTGSGPMNVPYGSSSLIVKVESAPSGSLVMKYITSFWDVPFDRYVYF